jgi:NADH-quinone oxidoreductase subunit N
LLQRNIKRMLAYSSISHSGYMLVGLAVGPLMISHSITNGVSAMLFYLGAYSVMTVGAFAVLVYLQGKLDAAEDLDDIAGIASAHPLAAACMAVCMLSLIGMPFTVGFLGKLFIVQAAFSSGHGALAVIVMINAAIAAAYYLSIITSMYLRDPWTPFAVRRPGAIQFSAAIAAALVILLGVFPSVLMSISRYSGTEVANMVVLKNSQIPTISKNTSRPLPVVHLVRSRSTPLASTHNPVAAAL